MSTVNEEKNVPSEDNGSSKKEASSKSYQGRVVSVVGNKLVMANKEGKEHSHWLAMDAKLTCDGVVCTPEELKPGNKIRVTTTIKDRTVATGVESLDKNLEFAPRS